MTDHLSQGERQLRTGDLDGALRSFGLAVELRPDSHKAIYFAALTHLKMGQEATAVVMFNRALEMDPNNPNYLSDLAVTKMRIGDRVGALRDLDRCVRLDPEYGYRYALRAYARNSVGDAQGAMDDYRKAVELDPEDAISYNNLGMVEEQMGYISQAKRNFAEADRLSGIDRQTPPDHTIDLRDRKDRSPEAVTESLESPRPSGYWEVFRSVFTDKAQRQEFIRFVGNLLKSPLR